MTKTKVQIHSGTTKCLQKVKDPSASNQNDVSKKLKFGSVTCPGLNSAVVEEILLNLPAEDVVLKCRLVCHEWKELVDSQAHWRERCRREGIEPCRREGIEPCNASRPPTKLCLFYFMTKKRRNLLKNTRAEDHFNGWILVKKGGDKWKIEENFAALPNDNNKKCFSTSYRLCLKQQLIHLIKEGYSSAIMDLLQPDIKISDWYAPSFDCRCYYKICVELLDQEKNPISVFQPEKVFFKQWNDQRWCQMTHVFKNYGPGVRFIRFTHGGKDTKFWAGWYGVWVVNSSVEIGPAI